MKVHLVKDSRGHFIGIVVKDRDKWHSYKGAGKYRELLGSFDCKFKAIEEINKKSG
jgi:hypothetical protein